MLVRQNNGSSRYGLIVGLTGGIMRVALTDSEDVTEFKLIDGMWVSEECEVVSFEFPPGLARHDEFRQAVRKVIAPVEGLSGYLATEEWATETIN